MEWEHDREDAMKTYSQLLEDIELTSGIGRMGKDDIKAVQDEHNYDTRKKNLGKIHKDYSIHRSQFGDFNIVHDKTKKVVGQIQNETPGKRKHLKVGLVAIHKDHSKKKIGHSLAVAAYKHLHANHGYTIHSGREQSPGGASIWQHLMKDPKTSKHVRAVITRKMDGDTKDIGQASKMNPADIWTSGSREMRRKAASKGIRMHKHMSPEDVKAFGTQLVLKAKKR
jgi:hypothetical protein